MKYDVSEELKIKDGISFPADEGEYGSIVIQNIAAISLEISQDPNVIPRVSMIAKMYSSGHVATYLKDIVIGVDIDGENENVDFPLPIQNKDLVVSAVVEKASEFLMGLYEHEGEEGDPE